MLVVIELHIAKIIHPVYGHTARRTKYGSLIDLLVSLITLNGVLKLSSVSHGEGHKVARSRAWAGKKVIQVCIFDDTCIRSLSSSTKVLRQHGQPRFLLRSRRSSSIPSQLV